MKLLTPRMLPVSAFDPSAEHTFSYLYDGEVWETRLIITDNSTGSIVYDKTKAGLRLQHELERNTLQPGRSYLARIQVLDRNGAKSSFSENILFYCYTEPHFAVSGISDEELIYKSELQVSVDYRQQEGEILREIQFFLYHMDGSIAVYSDVLYPDNPQSSISYTFHDLKNETGYYVEAVGLTRQGMSLKTEPVTFHVKYVTIPANIIFQVKNQHKEGYITIFSRIIDIGYDIDCEERYCVDNGAVTIWDNNKITYNKGFEIEGDFVLHIESRQLPLCYPFLRLNRDIALSIVKQAGSYYCKLEGIASSQYARLPGARLITTDDRYLVTSQNKVLEIYDSSCQTFGYVVFEIKRINGVYGLRAYYRSDIYRKEEFDI